MLKFNWKKYLIWININICLYSIILGLLHSCSFLSHFLFSKNHSFILEVFEIVIELCFWKNLYFLGLNYFFIFLDHFDILILKINKKYYFNIFLYFILFQGESTSIFHNLKIYLFHILHLFVLPCFWKLKW